MATRKEYAIYNIDKGAYLSKSRLKIEWVTRITDMYILHSKIAAFSVINKLFHGTFINLRVVEIIGVMHREIFGRVK